jgi:hypothetical protein
MHTETIIWIRILPQGQVVVYGVEGMTILQGMGCDALPLDNLAECVIVWVILKSNAGCGPIMTNKGYKGTLKTTT